LIGCLDGSLEILEIQVEGKRKMEIGEFLRGNSGMFRT
jgi:methionyl-tRNA formyltransferase